MEKKYPVLKCNKELWNEIKPVLESFGINDFEYIGNFEEYPFLVSNYGFCDRDELGIGNIDYNKIDMADSIRYLVDTKEEFLSAIAKLLNKEYPVKENKQDTEAKYPCIKCTQQLYDRIKNILKVVGYTESNMDEITFDFVHNPYLVVNYLDEFGVISNLKDITKPINNRYLCSNIREFLVKVCELKGFEVSYVDFVGDNNAENHYFKYILDKEAKTIVIHETREDEGECSATVTREKQWRKKPKKEDMVISYDPAVGESTSVVTTMPAKGNDFDKDKNMEKINIANKLRHCKKGTKLYSPIFGEVKLNEINNNTVYVKAIDDNNSNSIGHFNEYGQYYNCYKDAECLLFPSKDNRDWNSFQVLEEGHRVMCSDNAIVWTLEEYSINNKSHIIGTSSDNFWNYIVPVEDFDFTAEDITINKEKSII